MKMQYHGPATNDLTPGEVYERDDLPQVDDECWSTPSNVPEAPQPEPVSDGNGILPEL